MLEHGYSLQPGQLLHGRYRIVRLLGSGGMSSVYLAEDERLASKQWAIKVSKPVARDMEQLVHEARLLTALRHPHLPLIVDFYPPDASGRAYLVMEYIEGVTLGERMRERPVTFTEAIGYAVPICEALSYLHSRHPPIVFRDMKPSNIMLSRQGQVKLIDFGIARNVDADKDHDTVKLGTVGFAAPEQYEGKQSDARTDLYGIGALLAYMMSDGRWKGEIPIPPQCLADDVLAGFLPVLVKLLAIRPEHRYQSAQELLEVLRPFAAGDTPSTVGINASPYAAGRTGAGVVIAFHGTSSGIGATHAALMCAYHLSAGELGRAAYVDARDEADGAVIRALDADYEGEEPDAMDSRKTAGDDAEGVRLHGVTCYRWTQGNLLPYLLGRYEYVVLDTGADATGRRIEEFERAQIPVLVGSASPWRREELREAARRFEANQCTHWIAAISHADAYPAWRPAWLRGRCRGVAKLPHQPNPFEWSEDALRWTEELVGSGRTGRRWLNRFGRWMKEMKLGKGEVRS
ncbi:serine/threonine protein kinase [Paenibacillus thiaminolyticus]|uniref:Serine/threonine protein kinase n=1 Tax=Paenibacillus thiaminolyticus TaxID=49283 RepID=A0AAP9DRN2_PANTH|nr:serine/threonine-protein kinase [Paenibacillus thiaminolyticus]MCY9536078.1 serine/threonine protein kinase [Paenibacillus thiaminolyticus]MCY9602261.1 serine/threonine protein kinase [Paenibacillus thiaminolyticus]MCY9608656.1 serine/threonine protein kinase [Paenibacillus thiaminolyticus]MCY9613402.1 serine/threonine protein kinase [Paenibacillus thiaminolyticus]MCY9620221.1 serine/threonine protein kinase [Paenibacillus thiaminolyticus]